MSEKFGDLRSYPGMEGHPAVSETSGREAAIREAAKETLRGPGHAEHETGGWRLAARHAQQVEWLLAELAAAREEIALRMKGAFKLQDDLTRAEAREEKLREALREIGDLRLDVRKDTFPATNEARIQMQQIARAALSEGEG